MQPRHCFRNKGGTGLERDGFGGNDPKFKILDFIETGLNFIWGARTPQIKFRLFYSQTGFRLDLDRSKLGLNRLYQFWQPPNAFENVLFGDLKYGFLGSVPAEMLHVSGTGLLKHMFGCLDNLIGGPNSKKR